MLLQIYFKTQTIGNIPIKKHELNTIFVLWAKLILLHNKKEEL